MDTCQENEMQCLNHETTQCQADGAVPTEHHTVQTNTNADRGSVPRYLGMYTFTTDDQVFCELRADVFTVMFAVHQRCRISL